ncbi:hypothetical protein E4U14_008454 [Claviceps sp. LM454 group G7]|nr:hypothetical protein E4U14_008454 [Claviceps sp. LM454 group G7]
MARRSATVIVSCIHPAVGGVDARKDFGEVFGTLDYRHIGIGIGRKYVDQNFAKDCFTDEMDDVEEEEIAIEDPLEMSAGRGRPATEPEAPRARNGGNSGEEDEVLLDRRADHTDHSHHSHHLQPLRSRSYCDIHSLYCGTDNAVEADAVASLACVRRRWGLAIAADPIQFDSAVETAYKSPEQEQALERIMNNADPALVVVLPTGGGKSLLFTAPACLEYSGMTIVVVPYRQLITETVNDAVARDIESMEWTPLLQAPVDLVVVSADRRQPDRPILPLHHADDRERMATTSLLRQMPPGNHSAQLASQVDTSAKTQIDQRAHDHAYRHTTTAHGAGV